MNNEPNTSLIFPAGTQIVLLNEIKIINENRFHPAGTVGVIAELPVDALHAYRIKFADGSEAMASRKDFAIKKHYQREQGGLVSPLEDYKLYDFIIYKCIVGSKAFGLETETSDTDWRGIYLPPARIHWSMYGVPEQLEDKDNEECYWELQKFLILALKANPNILECLYTPLVEYANETARELLAMRDIFLSKLVYQTYNGYVMSQFKKLEGDLRGKGKFKGKHAMHLIRLLKQGAGIMREGILTVEVGEDRELLLQIKRGELSWDEIDKLRLALHRDFEKAFQKTSLPERPDYERANEFLIAARKSQVD